VPLSSIILRNKNANAAFDVKGLKLVEPVIEETEKIELELHEEVVKKKKVTKKSNKEIYFDKEVDNKIIEDYNKQDIMELSTNYNVRPWEIVSLLIRYKIITKRDQALGYDKYKQTEEYKQKIKEK
jgi:hypothetical protein